MVFGILIRSDVSLLKVCYDDDIYALGQQLSRGHVFSVDVWAIFHDDVTGSKLLEQLEPSHLANGWYDVTLIELTRMLGLALNGDVEVSLLQQKQPAYDDDSDVSANISCPTSLGACEAKYAPSATKLKAELQGRLGKEDTKLVLSQLKQKVRRNEDGTVGRMLTFNDIPMKLES